MARDKAKAAAYGKWYEKTHSRDRTKRNAASARFYLKHRGLMYMYYALLGLMNREELCDGYVRARLGMRLAVPPQALIEAKRAQLLLTRATK